MNKENNELDSQEDLRSVSHKENGEDSVSSVRRKYQKGKKESNINYGVVLGHKSQQSDDIPNLVQKEEYIHYQKEVTKTIEDDYSSNDAGSSLVKKSKEEKTLPVKVVKNLKKDFGEKNEEIVEQHSKIEKEIESTHKEIMKDLEKHLDLKDIKMSSKNNSGNLNPNELKEATYIKKTIQIISKTSTDGKLLDDGSKDLNNKSKNEVTTSFTKTSLVNQVNETSQPEIKEKINTSENFTNNEEKTSKITIIKEDNSSGLLVNKNEKKQEIKEEIQDVQAQKEVFSETKVTKTTEKIEENVEKNLPKPKPEIEFKKDTKITTTTTNVKTKPILPKKQTQQTEVNKLSEIITKKKETHNQIINKGRQTPSQKYVKGRITPNVMINKGRQIKSRIINTGRQTPNVMINKGRQIKSRIINTGRQTPNQYLFSKTTTTTTTVTDNPIPSLLNRSYKDIVGSSSTTVTNRRNKKITSNLPKISESAEKRSKILSNQTTSVLANLKRIEPFNIKNERYDFNKVTITNESHLRNDLSTPAIRGGATKSILDIRKPLNTISQESLNNLSTITISDTGKKPKKQYILNVRNTDVIKAKNRIRFFYPNDPNNKEFINTDFNLRSKVVKNFSKEHNNSAYLPNTVYHEINETRQHGKKEVHISPRKYMVIKTKRKPLKYSYTISNTDQPLFRNSVQTTTSTITENTLIRGRKSKPEPYSQSTYQLKSNYLTSFNTTGSKNLYTKSKYEPISNRSKYQTNTTVTTKVSGLRNTRNKIKERTIPLTAGNSKTNLYKTTETRVTNRNNRNERRFNRIVKDSGNKNNLNSNKVIAIKTSKVITDSGINNDKLINNADYNYEKKVTKIVIEGSSSSVVNSGSDSLNLKLAKDIDLGNSGENKVSVIKKQESSTITTKEIKIENSDGSGTEVKESRFVRMSKKEE